MVTIDDLRSVARPPDGPPPDGSATMVLHDDSEADAVLLYLAEDRSRQAVRVLLRSEDIGYVRRDSVYEFFPELSKRLGDTARVPTPLGAPPSAYRWMELRCPEPECAEGPVLTMRFDEDDPPRCPRHTGQPLRLEP